MKIASKYQNNTPVILHHTLEFHAAELMRSISVPFLSVDTNEWQVIYASNLFEKLFGKKKGEFAGKNFWEVIKKEEEYNLFYSNFKKAAKTNQALHFEIKNPRKKLNGETTSKNVWFLVNVYPANHSLVVIMIDITDRKQVEQDLRKFYSAVEQTADSVFMTDVHGNIEYVNPAFEKLTGYKEKEAIGQTPRIVKSGLRDKDYYNNLWKTILSGKTFRNQVINRKKNGEFFHADHTITPLKNKNGQIEHFVGIWKDITEQMEMEKRREEFISIASHELKTPLSNIAVIAQVIKKLHKDASPEHLKYIGRLDNQVKRLSDIVNDLLDVSKLQSGSLDIKKEVFSLSLLSKEIAENFEALGKHKIIVKTMVMKKVYADRERINQVITNLVSNAIKYSPEGKKIIITIEGSSKCFKVSVKDYGMGISKEHINNIFERFYRGHAKNLKAFPGLGMGLYISKQIVEKHNGKIWAKSKVGKGSTFYFTLPTGSNS